MRKIAELFGGPKIEVRATSGMLCVDIQQRPQPLAALVTSVGDGYSAWFLHARWLQLPLIVRMIWIWAMVSSVPLLLYLLFGKEEVVEIDANKLTIRKGFHGWERKREYRIADCRELECQNGGKDDRPRLECKVAGKTIRFGDYMPEAAAVEILTALQRTLPDVAQKICAYPGGKEQFLTLRLNR